VGLLLVPSQFNTQPAFPAPISNARWNPVVCINPSLSLELINGGGVIPGNFTFQPAPFGVTLAPISASYSEDYVVSVPALTDFTAYLYVYYYTAALGSYVYMTGNGPGNLAILGTHPSTSGNWGMYCGSAFVSSGEVMPQQQWTLLTITRTAGTVRLYRDGVLKNTVTNATTVAAFTRFTFNSYITSGGYGADAGTRYGLAGIDTVAWSADEIAAIGGNPWSIFQAPDEEIWVNAGSGVALASSALASATGSAALSVAIPIIGASAAATTGQGTLSVALPLAAAGVSAVVGSATLNTNQALASSAAANTTGQGTLGVAQAIAGSGIATATGTGSLSLSIPINSAALANVIGSGTLNGSVAFASSAVAGVLGQGNLSLSIALSAAAIANAIGSGNLGVSGLFESHAVASAAGHGTLTQRIPISGVSLSATNGSGSLTQLVPISGSSVVLANGQGALHLTISMNAAALAQAMGIGNLTLRLTLSGYGLANAIGSATLGGMHRPINPEFFIIGNSVVRYVLGNALIRSL
jgi:hypothetical protein